MRIVHLNTHDGFGAGRALGRIHAGLLALGEESSLIVQQKSGTDSAISAFAVERGLAARFRRVWRQSLIDRDAQRYLANKPSGYEWFSDDRSSLAFELWRTLPRADVVVLNWVAGFVDVGAFFRGVPPGTKVVWRLPDMNPFTGGCHVDGGCGRYVESCGECPQLARRGPNDLSRQIWKRKMLAYRLAVDAGLHVVALSSSQADEVRRSSLLGSVPLSVIPCAVDPGVFSPLPKSSARAKLGLPADETILLMAAHSLHRPNKGAGLLSEALASLGGMPPPLVVSVGAGELRVPEGFRYARFGPVDDDRQLVSLYSAADLLVFPSVQEGFGQTIVEALACGLPVAGFDTGGMRDAVTEGATGFIAPVKSSEALAHTLQNALVDVRRLREMAGPCRQTAVTRFSVDMVARRYQALYRSLIGSGDPAGRL